MQSATIARTVETRAPARAPRVVPTAAAWRALRRICRAEGRVVLVHAPADGGLLCFGERDYVPGPTEARVAELCGCPFYADVRVPLPGRTLFVDLLPDPDGDDASEFVLREMPAPPADEKDQR